MVFGQGLFTFCYLLTNYGYLLLLFLWILVTFCVTCGCNAKTIVITTSYRNISCNQLRKTPPSSGVNL